MATKEEFIAELTKLPGVGKATAEKLWDAGYRSLDDLKGVTAETLVQKGLGKRAADAVVAGLGAPAEKQAVKVVEAGEAAAEKAEVVEPSKAYAAKIKPALTPEVKAALSERASRKAHEPEFKRYHWFFKPSLERHVSWRRPRGNSNKQRRGFNYRPPRVKVGFGKPAAARGLHPSGFAEVLVYNVKDLSKVDPKAQAARIGGTVGGKKRKDIEAKAAEMQIRILNPRRT
jgi:large subunit ribosomal protein L32e